MTICSDIENLGYETMVSCLNIIIELTSVPVMGSNVSRIVNDAVFVGEGCMMERVYVVCILVGM